MTRSTQEVFASHREAIEKLDMEQLAADYADDAVMVTVDGTHRGRDAIMTDFFQVVFGQFPDLTVNFEKTVVADEICLLQWSGEASGVSVPAAVAVFIVKDGLIQRQVEWAQMVPK